MDRLQRLHRVQRVKREQKNVENLQKTKENNQKAMDNERESLWDHLSHVYKKALSDIILDASIKYKDFIQTSNKPLESMDYVHSQICSKLYKNAEILRLNDLYSDEIQKYKETHSNNHNK